MPREIIAALAGLAAIVAVVGIWPSHRRLPGYGPPTKHLTFRLVRVSPSMSHCSATSTPSTSTVVCIVRWNAVPG
jgi:hypothetical protein